MARDACRLALGTLTVVRVPAPRSVTPAVAGTAMVLGPLAALPLGVAVTVVCLLGQRLGLPAMGIGMLAVGTLALGTRILHWDGLADVADGLTASYDRERALAVMKTGTSGPAGVVAIVVVAGLQAVGIGALAGTPRGAVTAGVAVCLARCALSTACARGVPSARPDGLGATVAGTVPVAAALVWWLVAGALLVTLAGWPGAAAAGIAALVVALLVTRCVRRFGGITGDVLGAGVELAAAALLISLSVG